MLPTNRSPNRQKRLRGGIFIVKTSKNGAVQVFLAFTVQVHRTYGTRTLEFFGIFNSANESAPQRKFKNVSQRKCAAKWSHARTHARCLQVHVHADRDVRIQRKCAQKKFKNVHVYTYLSQRKCAAIQNLRARTRCHFA